MQKLQSEMDMDRLIKMIEKRLLKDEADAYFDDFQTHLTSVDKGVQRVS